MSKRKASYLNDREEEREFKLPERRNRQTTPTIICLDCGYTWNFNGETKCPECKSYSLIEE